MMNHVVRTSFCAAIAVLIACGYATAGQKAPQAAGERSPYAICRHTTVPVVVDGKLDDAAWKNAFVYPVGLGKDRVMSRVTLQEPGEAMLCWDDENLYVGVRFTDSDVCTEAKEDQGHFYGQGDVLEFFIKGPADPQYWELYAAPNGKKTTFWYPSRGRLLPGCFTTDTKSDLRVGATVEGTLNNFEDRDIAWSAEMAIPLKTLATRGNVFAPGQPWKILVARYNYSRYLQGTELSMFPKLATTNYHLQEDYAILKIEK